MRKGKVVREILVLGLYLQDKEIPKNKGFLFLTLCAPLTAFGNCEREARVRTGIHYSYALLTASHRVNLFLAGSG